MNCAICSALGEEKAGTVPDGWGFPICAQHRAESYWRSRQPAPPQVITFGPPNSIDEALARGIDVQTLATGVGVA